MNERKTKILDKLYSLQRFGMKPGLERTEDILRFLGAPHKNLRIIHVAGTNGKGAVCALIASILQESGYKTGLYSSPHLIAFNERIRVDGRAISDERLVELAEPLLEYSERSETTFFEITTAIAFKHFADVGLDFAVVETGMGGRFDSTNVANPAVSVITSVSKDHTEYLGDSIVKIAFEKAGIIKAEKPVVVSQRNAGFDVIKRVAADRKAPLVVAEDCAHIENIEYKPDLTMRADISTPDENMRRVEIPFCGAGSVENLILALACLYTGLQLKIDAASIRNGIADIRKNSGWRGRLELVRAEPPIILDAGHNPAALENLARSLKLAGLDKSRFQCVYAAMKDKDVAKSLEALRPLCRKFIATRPNIARAETPQNIAEIAKSIGYENVETAICVEAAVNTALDSGEGIIFAGSFFLIAEILPILKKINIL